MDSGAQRYPLKVSGIDKKGLVQAPKLLRNAIRKRRRIDRRAREELLDWGTRLRAYCLQRNAKRHLLEF